MKPYVLFWLACYVMFVAAMFGISLWVQHVGPLAYEAPLDPGVGSAIGAGMAVVVMVALRENN
jgi:hypothetical protein